MKAVYLLLIPLLFSCNKKHGHSLPDPIYVQPTIPIPPVRPPPSSAGPGFQVVDNVEDSILLDLQNLDSDQERRDTRYFVGCDRSNNGEDLTGFTEGVNRGLNQLSSERELFFATPVGSSQCVYRVDLSLIGWTAADWSLIGDNDVLQFESKTVRNQNIQFLTQARRPYLFASSALLTAYEGDAVANKNGAIYYTIMNQAANTETFLQSRGVNRQREVNNEDAMFSGFSGSQIALGKTRIIQIFESNDGACAGTADTALGGDDIFSNPFTPELAKAGQVNGVQVTNKVFRHEAQEWICSLPNGIFGEYRLNNAADVAEVVAPANIVTNLQGAAQNIDSQIRTGDCMTCHYKESAILGFKDQLRSHLVTSPSFNAAEKKLGSIFFRFDKITAKVAELNRNHTRAMNELGVVSDEDPLWNVVMKPLRKEMRAEQVAGLMLMDVLTFKEKLRGAPISSQVFGNLLTDGGTVNLATLSKGFQLMTEETAAYEDENL
jgi:hypothetical protein